MNKMKRCWEDGDRKSLGDVEWWSNREIREV